MGRPPTPTITATLVPTTCRKGLLGLLMACNNATCRIDTRTQKLSDGPKCSVRTSNLSTTICPRYLPAGRQLAEVLVARKINFCIMGCVLKQEDLHHAVVL